MKKTAYLYPISKNAYARFVKRITTLVKSPEKRKAMLCAFDLYLSGDIGAYLEILPYECKLAFEMLRFEIDLAIMRSSEARHRARIRKEARAMKQETEPKEIADMALGSKEEKTAEAASGSSTSVTDTADVKVDNTPGGTPAIVRQPSATSAVPSHPRRTGSRPSTRKLRWRKKQ